MPEIQIEALNLDDYDALYAFWRATPGVGLSTVDSRDGLARYIARNPAASFQARWGDQIVGSVLGGHDGRRGFLYHLAVASICRRQGIGRRLVAASLAALRAEGIEKCHLMVFSDNDQALAFWRRLDWVVRDDLRLVSFELASMTGSPAGTGDPD
jgi:ribosomal protein S18 acetylase RimI-like enzyme